MKKAKNHEVADNWTPPLSVEGSAEVLHEQEERAALTPQRLAMLERVRAVVLALRGPL
jgi:hypothetical protein